MSSDDESFAGEERFREVFRRYRKPIYNFFARRGCSPDDCDELNQETFLRVYKGIESVRSEEALKVWIFTVATNVFLNWLRKRSAQMRDGKEIYLDAVKSPDEGGEPVQLPSPDPGVLSALLQAERSRKLREALDHLPEKMRQCLILRIDGELRYREIAKELEISIDTVKAHLHHAKKRLKMMIEDDFAIDDFDEEDPGDR